MHRAQREFAGSQRAEVLGYPPMSSGWTIKYFGLSLLLPANIRICLAALVASTLTSPASEVDCTVDERLLISVNWSVYLSDHWCPVVPLEDNVGVLDAEGEFPVPSIRARKVR